MWVVLAKKLLPYFLITGVILATGFAVYRFGYKNGSRDVHLEWDQDKTAARTAYDALVAQMAELEEVHRIEQEGTANELAQVRKDHEMVLSNQRIDFNRRLLQSASRADVYQRQAEAGAAACRDLAGHAARLDRTLEEGRGLVLELSATLGLREHQLKQLGAQLLNDRQLFTGAGER